MRNKPLVFLAISFFVAVLGLAPRLSHADELSFPAQALSESLRALGNQTKTNMLFDPVATARVNAPAVSKAGGVEEALKRLLVGSGLTFRFVDPRTVTVIPEDRSGKDDIREGSVGATEIGSLRLAQAEGTTEGSATGGEQQAAPKDQEEPAEGVQLEEIVVTGTHIRGIRNNGAPLTTYDRSQIDRRGYLTTQDFIRSLPQNFKGGDNGASEDGVINSINGLSNVESASGINLRGLGTGSTLVLINGHRVAPANVGATVDVSMIPLDAIDRIDVMTDGASAIYGSDAVGGVVNFMLRKDYDGAQTSLFGSAPTRGGREEYGAGQTFGRSSDVGGALLSIQYQYSGILGSEDRDLTSDVPGPTDLYPASRQYSGIFNGHRQLTENLHAFADALYNHAEDERDYTFFGLTQGPRTDTDSASINTGLSWQPFGTWRFEASGLYSQVDTLIRQQFSPPIDGYTNGGPFQRNDFELFEGSIKGDGALFDTPGGTVRAAVGASWRHEDFSLRTYRSTAVFGEAGTRKFSRDVTAEFVEIHYPLVSDMNTMRFARQLDFSVSARHEHYTDFGDSTNPKIGVFWRPSNALGLRASYGRSFHAPTAFDEISNSVNLFVFNFPFASPAGGEETVLVLSGSPNLTSESSRDFTIGIEYQPEKMPGARLSLNYFSIDYRDRLVTIPFDASALLLPDVYGSLITDFPDDAAVASYVADLEAQGFIFVDFTETGFAGIRHGVTTGALTNASRVRQKGIDADLRYEFVIGSNKLDIGFNAALIDEIRTGFCSSCSATDLVNTYGQPLRLRWRADGGWSRGPWQWNVALNHANSYSDTTIAPPDTVASWTTLDMNMRYTLEWLKGGTVGLNIINALDKDPPRTRGATVFTSLHYDSANADPLGRIVSAQARWTW